MITVDVIDDKRVDTPCLMIYKCMFLTEIFICSGIIDELFVGILLKSSDKDKKIGTQDSWTPKYCDKFEGSLTLRNTI